MTEEIQETTALPPWNHPDFLTEVGLREAREYFFQTHATHARMMQEGRAATGFMKGAVRRKLSKEMGEDFKMFTGQDIGKTSESEESKGIRGELNLIFKGIYNKFSPKKPAESPLMEDLTLLNHPLGVIEVLFGLTCYYAVLSKRYASLSGERRKVLRGVLDEELFKWIWRNYYAMVLGHAKKMPSFHENVPSIGLRHIPRDKERLATSDKLVEIGKFLLGTALSSSHLRFPICYYYVSYLRTIQVHGLLNSDRGILDKTFEQMRKFKENEPTDNVLLAVDVLMNLKGNSQQSFDDVLKSEDQEIQRFIPPDEILFMAKFQEYGKTKLPTTLKKLMPKATRNDDEQSNSLMPLVMLMRTLPFGIVSKLLTALPGPSLNMIKNRLSIGDVDSVSKELLDMIEGMIAERHQKGEKYNIYGSGRGQVSMQSVRPEVNNSQPVKKEGAASQTTSTGGAGELRAARTQAAPAATSAAPTSPPSPAPETAQPHEDLLEEQILIGWKAGEFGIEGVSVSPGEILELVGPDSHFLLPWAILTLQTGQVYRLPPDKISKEHVSKVLRSIMSNPAAPKEGELSPQEKTELKAQCQGLPPQKVLKHLVDRFGIGMQGRRVGSGQLSIGIRGLAGRFAGDLPRFLENPTVPDFKPMLAELTGEEKYAVGVLRRVARIQ